MARKQTFNAHKAARQIFALMKKMGVNVTNHGNDSWVDKISDKESVIALKRNCFRFSVTEDGIAWMSHVALFSSWSVRTKSQKAFKKHMQHVLVHMQ